VNFWISGLVLASAAMGGSLVHGASFDLNADKPASLRFFGSKEADLFTKEISESYAGVLSRNYISDKNSAFLPGFVRASPQGQIWGDTFWARDGGTFLRELVMWGNFEHACQTADCLIKMVGKNNAGFYSFPEYFSAGDKKSGDELDGTSAIIIGMVLLWERLPHDDPFKATLYDFLHGDASPVRYLQHQLSGQPLLLGQGEFGGGCGIPGQVYNVVQNNLAMMAFTAACNMESEAGDHVQADACFRDAQTLRDNMEKYLVDADGAWIWCIDPKTLKPNLDVINNEINKGFGGLNGAACMYADVLGFEPLASQWKGVEHGQKTFEKLLSFPLRKEQFDRHGIWTQFDVYRAGLSSCPSYADGYALQTMLLYDKLDMADKSVAWLANSTYQPIKAYHVDRASPYYFYERSYSPEAEGKTPLDQGCGALNLVNVTEPLKAARLMLGVDDTSLEEVKIIPRIPPSWKGAEATDWPIRTSSGIVKASITCQRVEGGIHLQIKLPAGQKIPKLAVRLNGKWFKAQDVTKADFLPRSQTK
jgi:hypothetical protein